MAYYAGNIHTLYRHYDDAGRLLYVGITTSLTCNSYAAYPYAILNHKTRQPSSTRGARLTHHKSQPWYPQIKTITLEQFPDRAAAENAERWAIHDEKPLYNKSRLKPRTPADLYYDKLWHRDKTPH